MKRLLFATAIAVATLVPSVAAEAGFRGCTPWYCIYTAPVGVPGPPAPRRYVAPFQRGIVVPYLIPRGRIIIPQYDGREYWRDRCYRNGFCERLYD